MPKQTITLEGDEIKLIKYIDLLKQWTRDDKTGKLTFNFFKGGISNVNVCETIKFEQCVGLL